jgi:hypothetical protein
MSSGSSKSTGSTTAHYEASANGWRGFREARCRGETAVLGNSGYHYVPPGPTRFVSLEFCDGLLVAALEDGRVIRVPIAWFPILRDTSPEERSEIEFDHRRTWAFSPKLNTEVSVDQVLAYCDGADEETFIAASASDHEQRLVADIGALVRKARRVIGKSAEEIFAEVVRSEPL